MSFVRITANIVKKDWTLNLKNILMFTGGMFIPLFIPSNDIKEGMMAGILVAAAFGYMYMVFMIERARRSLPLLLGLPVRPLTLITAKYLSLYSMCLVTVNFAGVFLRDSRTLYLMNAEVLFLATVLMAAAAVFEHPVAPLIPLFLVAMIFEKDSTIKAITPYEFQIASFALAVSPVIALVSALQFKKNSTVQPY